jgi:hypothetical protein
MLEYGNVGMMENCLTMLVCRRPRLHKYGRGRPYADIETAHYFNIPAHKLLSRLFPGLFTANCHCAAPGGALVYCLLAI